MQERTFTILRSDRASRTCKCGETVYPGRDSFNCATDDTRHTGIEHTSISYSPSGLPFFTIPKEDIKEIKS